MHIRREYHFPGLGIDLQPYPEIRHHIHHFLLQFFIIIERNSYKTIVMLPVLCDLRIQLHHFKQIPAGGGIVHLWIVFRIVAVLFKKW